MWPRIFEFSLGVWLAISPFIFGHFYHENILYYNDFSIALLIFIFSLASYNPKYFRLHLLNIPFGLYLIGITFALAPSPTPAYFQNYVVSGILLLMFCVLPSHSSDIPIDWQRFHNQKRK